MEHMNMGARAYERILKVTRTIADLEGLCRHPRPPQPPQPPQQGRTSAYRNLDRPTYLGSSL